jgi:membrane-associated phospholipid phosphatase
MTSTQATSTLDIRVNRPIRTLRPVASRQLIAVLLWSLLASGHLAAQRASPTLVTTTDALMVGGAALLHVVPMALHWHEPPPSCAPCDRSSVPFFDRWAIHQPESVPRHASDLVLAGVALASWIDLAAEGRGGQAGFVASLESLLWANAVTTLTKEAIGRKRPVLYTDSAPDEADSPNNLRSMPSGHTSIAFALATSYWLSRRNVTTDDRPWLRWALMAGATGVGVLRVAAGKHHPSDAVLGAGVGIASAVLVHTVKF